jgi:polysaccharide biosynthesis/export protein
MGGWQVNLSKFQVWLGAASLMMVLGAQKVSAQNSRSAGQIAGQAAGPFAGYQQTTDDYNHHLLELNRSDSNDVLGSARSDYRIGADDQIDISVLEDGSIDRPVRVSASGQIALPLVGTVRAAGLTTQELSAVIEEILRRSYIKDPHVTVQVREMQSHSVSAFGAVKKPGVFQIRGPKSVIELLSMAEGLNDDAGDTVIIDRHEEIPGFRSGLQPDAAKPAGRPDSNESTSDSSDAASRKSSADSVDATAQKATGSTPAGAGNAEASQVVSIDLKKLLETGDSQLNVLVYPGDIVKVTRAELVYVVGEVAKPGGFQLKSNENVSVLQAIALAQGLTHTSAAAHSKIIHTDPVTGRRQEIPIDLKKVLAGKVADPILAPRDIVFVPNSASRTAMYRSIDAAISVGTGVAVYRW